MIRSKQPCNLIIIIILVAMYHTYSCILLFAMDWRGCASYVNVIPRI